MELGSRSRTSGNEEKQYTKLNVPFLLFLPLKVNKGEALGVEHNTTSAARSPRHSRKERRKRGVILSQSIQRRGRSAPLVNIAIFVNVVRSSPLQARTHLLEEQGRGRQRKKERRNGKASNRIKRPCMPQT